MMQRVSRHVRRALAWTICVWLIGVLGEWANCAEDVRLPSGVKVEWNTDRAYHETTATRQRISINGLWCWQPAEAKADAVPEGNWGYFKVPGSWPGITDYMQKDCQTLFAHAAWQGSSFGEVTAAWYQRELRVPGSWAGRRITLSVECLNSYAAVYLDGKRAGEIRFPGGEVDLTEACRPGNQHVLSMLVVALPLQAVMLSYHDTASAREVKGSVARRGLCGDVYLASTPAGARIADAKIDTSVRKWEVAINAAVQGAKEGERYTIRARIEDHGRVAAELRSPVFRAEDLKEGRIAFARPWKAEKLWDLHTPGNQYDLHLTLEDAAGKPLDVLAPMRFGFREFWIDGRDFYLNGTRLFLSAVPLDNAQVGAAAASYEGARETLRRLQSFGINFVYTHNYGCEPGSHLSFSEILRAADDQGMLVALSQPHFSHYDWSGADADSSNGYARHAESYVRVAQNHPSVVMYSMSHNATGYNEDMDPQRIDGKFNQRDSWAQGNVKKALRAEAIVKRLDPGRIVYHHASGNLGPMHTSNFYPNFVPVQELSDWFEHWASEGVKPVFLCEYGAPFTWDWTMYRGWYKGQRSFGSAQVPWEFCLAEWNSQFLGDRAFRISEREKANLRWEAKQFRAGRGWHRWDYPTEVGSSRLGERDPVFALYYEDNWRAFRTWGVSANSPWEYQHLWTLRDGVDRGRKQLAVDWERLQRPGFSADYVEQRFERMDMAFEPSDWLPTAGAEALMRNNGPLLAYLAGKPARFTSKDHHFVAGETLEKQIVVINNSRQKVTCECSWSLALPQPQSGSRTIALETGQQQRMALAFRLADATPPGTYALGMKARFSTGQTQEDRFEVHVLPPPAALGPIAKVALFDPKGTTADRLKTLGVSFEAVDAQADLAAFDVLVIGKAALSVDGPAPKMARVGEGLKVLVLEQTADALEKRLGFRVQEYGLRNVFARVPNHPALAGLGDKNLRDWRGEATIMPARLKCEASPRYNGAPTVTWCGIEVTRLWRCGCQGNVASVLIEKPTCGDFLPLVDGGFSLQYSPLLEYREGKGVVLFCQMDVTGRTQSDPAAERLMRGLLAYISACRPTPRREVVYLGDPAGNSHLQRAGIGLRPYVAGELKPDQVLVVSSRAATPLASQRDAVRAFLSAGGKLLGLGLTQEDANAILPFEVKMQQAEHIAAYFEPPGADSPLVGIGPADVHNRDPRTLALVSGGANVVGDGVLAVAADARVVLCQLVPWQFDYRANFGVKRTFRRSSFTVARLLANLGGSSTTPLLARFSEPVHAGGEAGRWLEGLYLDKPEEMDDPYRFFRW